MTAGGIVKGNAITRRPPGDQFKCENWDDLRGVPWRLQAREAGEVRVDLHVVVGQPAQRRKKKLSRETSALRTIWRSTGTHLCAQGAKHTCAICRTGSTIPSAELGFKPNCLAGRRAREPRGEGRAAPPAAAAAEPVLFGHQRATCCKSRSERAAGKRSRKRSEEAEER